MRAYSTAKKCSCRLLQPRLHFLLRLAFRHLDTVDGRLFLPGFPQFVLIHFPDKGDPGQSSLFSLLGHLGSAQVVTINYLMLLDTLLLVEGMHNAYRFIRQAMKHAKSKNPRETGLADKTC